MIVWIADPYLVYYHAEGNIRILYQQQQNYKAKHIFAEYIQCVHPSQPLFLGVK